MGILFILLAPIVFAQSQIPRDLCFTSQSTVCGSDNIEYQNSCQAELEGVGWTNGACGSSNQVLQQNPVLIILIILGVVYILNQGN